MIFRLKEAVFGLRPGRLFRAIYCRLYCRLYRQRLKRSASRLMFFMLFPMKRKRGFGHIANIRYIYIYIIYLFDTTTFLYVESFGVAYSNPLALHLFVKALAVCIVFIVCF